MPKANAKATTGPSTRRRRRRGQEPTGPRGPTEEHPGRDLGERDGRGPRYNVTVSRLYKGDDHQWGTSESFGRDDLLLLAKVADLAHTWISEQLQAGDVAF